MLEIVVIDEMDRMVVSGRYPNGEEGWAEVVADAGVRRVSRVGIENASGYGVGLARALTKVGVTVIDVPTRFTAAGRRVQGRGKTDRIDARVVARTVAAGEGNQWVDAPDLEVIRMLCHRRNALVTDQTRDINQLRALLIELDPTVAARLRRLRSTRAFHQLTEWPTETDPRREVAAGLVRDLATDCASRLDRIRRLERQLDRHLPAAGQRLIETIDGCGVITAATLLAELAGTDGFATDAKFAAWAGVAPLDASSGRHQRHRLNRGGNRRVNQALHTITITQLHQGGEAAHYINRRQTEGLTRREAIRACKRHLARRVWKTINLT